MLKKLTIFLVLFLALNLTTTSIVHAVDMAEKLKGRILLQVEQNGEAWYVNPANLKRYYLGRPDDAFEVMRELGIGISNNDLNKIQVADANLISGPDTDEDGLSDMFEDAIGTDKNNQDTDNDGFNDKDELLQGYNPIGSEELNIDKNFTVSHAGKIFLQVEQNGEAWYINEENLERYYLGRPSDAFNLMRGLGLGITNSHLEEIAVANQYSSPLLKVMEKNVQELINKQRETNGLGSLKWNDDLAGVAREHSNNLAAENINLIDLEVRCSLPMIHHEGFYFGLFHSDRLSSRQVYYVSASAENIALIPAMSGTKYYYNSTTSDDIADCETFFNTTNSNFKSELESEESEEEKKTIVENEINYRADLVVKQSKIEIIEVDEKSADEIENDAVVGWMNSPGHRKNILTAEYDEAGVGIAEIKDYLIMTQVFITRTECGYQTGPCCEKAGYYPYCYEPFSCLSGVCGE